MAFSDKLRIHRTNINLTQEELADKINVSQKTISSWETGRSEPTMKELTRLCNLFDCTMSDLSDTRDRKTGEITMDDIFVKLRDMSLEDLMRLKEEVIERINIKNEMMAVKSQYDEMMHKVKEYEMRIKELERMSNNA